MSHQQGQRLPSSQAAATQGSLFPPAASASSLGVCLGVRKISTLSLTQAFALRAPWARVKGPVRPVSSSCLAHRNWRPVLCCGCRDSPLGPDVPKAPPALQRKPRQCQAQELWDAGQAFSSPTPHHFCLHPVHPQAGLPSFCPGEREVARPAPGSVPAPPSRWPFPAGEHLRICPQGYTCCTSEMEENLANRSRTELETALRDSSRALQAMLATQLRSFDDHFQHLLNDSERALQDAFPGAFGELYTQNARAFRDLYSELRLYYRGANLHLEETLAEFWARLLERLFRQLHPQLLLSDDYLDCLGKQAEALRPFGEAPRELRLRATRAFVAARSFVQGLGVASDVVRKVAQVPLGPECSRAVMKLVYCAHCLGVPGARPCPDYCRNVLKGCLANQADLDAEWRNLLDSMVLITDKFWGTSGVENVIGGVHTWLAEAVNSLQDNRDTLTAKVIQGCGNPKVNPQGPGPEDKRHRGKLAPRERPPSGTLEKLVSEAKAQLRDVQDFWISLPGTLCSEKMALSTASDDRCWNGVARGRYLPEVMGDGLANQINNPEVEVDITKPDMTIRQQIMQLKITTNRLRSAYNGDDVDFQDASDDGSGSGSGDGCPDDLCGRKNSRKSSSSRTPLTHALPGLSEQEGQKTSAASCPQPPSFLLPLLLALALTVARPRWR
ncbi:glycerophosphocholine acyltransferase [Saguinus oedipus]|uniref:Glypican-1 n=1 Tax=Saguinus oedipus TaxID=9490 RepID=A0ABQ9VFQ2_SAGOE|nr:glycerophosphocholine acyltransferase [Saguinus oedipus]